LEFLQQIDTSVFYFINKTLANPFTDKWMPVITDEKSWYIFYFIMGLYLLIKGGARGRIAVALVIILIFFTDQSANFIKEFIGRLRPCKELAGVNLLVGCASPFGLPSNHAVNNFAAATLLSYFYPNYKYVLFIGAFTVSISRIFCGVHYPFDILAGALYGIIAAMLLIFIWKLFNRKVHFLNR
jgi:undecaprenyl-diphosphatase